MPDDRRRADEESIADIAALRAEIAELKRQLGQNSQNSSKPPSADSTFAKPAPKSLRRNSGRKPGGQPGHPGSTLALVDDPDETLRNEPAACVGCGATICASAPDGVTAPVQYGPRVTAIVLYLYVRAVSVQAARRTSPFPFRNCSVPRCRRAPLRP
ncbi:DUF6444 domain-containing protein [Mycobacterium sp. HUMS_1102779]|uniref:DUF6444 domain-containing protein n=1 Tax=Mycobacterium sp. HUMS_1102779 TaxID=3383487 RepID=UPI00389A3E25